MKIVLTLNNYHDLTGSELYTFELARALLRRNAEVAIIAQQVGGEIAAKTPKEVQLYQFFAHPILTPDIVINSQPLPTSYALTKFPQAFHMQILHSILPYEEPIMSDQIRKYIAVRPEIKKRWLEKYPELESRLAVIWNGVDRERFNTNYETVTNEKLTTLFVGTFDHLRRNVILDLAKDAAEMDQILKLVLPVNPFGEDLPLNVYYMSPQWHIEKLVKECDQTAGIFIGRSTIEGFLCGKPGLVYDVDERGDILQKATYTVPENLEIFDSNVMAEKILAEYEHI